MSTDICADSGKPYVSISWSRVDEMPPPHAHMIADRANTRDSRSKKEYRKISAN